MTALATAGATAARWRRMDFRSDGVGLMTGDAPRAAATGRRGFEPARGREKLGVGMLFLPDRRDGVRRRFCMERCLRVAGAARAGLARCAAADRSCWARSRCSVMPSYPAGAGGRCADSAGWRGEAAVRLRGPLTGCHGAAAVLGAQGSSSAWWSWRARPRAMCVRLSTRTLIVYKSMCLGRLLPEFFPGTSSDPEYVTPIRDFSSALCDQYDCRRGTARSRDAELGHNGEINTVWGNRARMDARDSTLPEECKPVLTARTEPTRPAWMRRWS